MNPDCEQCIAIIRELHETYSESLEHPKAKDFYEFHSGIKDIVEGNGERLEEIFEKFPPWRGGDILQLELTPIGRAWHRASIHYCQTGHKLPMKLPFLGR